MNVLVRKGDFELCVGLRVVWPRFRRLAGREGVSGLQSPLRQQRRHAKKPDGHFFYFLRARSGGTIAAHTSDMTLGQKGPHRSDREGGRGQWGEQERVEVKHETPDGGVNALGTPLGSAPHSNRFRSRPGRLSLWPRRALASELSARKNEKVQKAPRWKIRRQVCVEKCWAAKWACSTFTFLFVLFYVLRCGLSVVCWLIGVEAQQLRAVQRDGKWKDKVTHIEENFHL